MVRDQGVGGSNPLSPTNLLDSALIPLGIYSGAHPYKERKDGAASLWALIGPTRSNVPGLPRALVVLAEAVMACGR